MVTARASTTRSCTWSRVRSRCTRASTSTRVSDSEALATQATRRATTCTSRSGTAPGTTAATRSTRCPTSSSGSSGLRFALLDDRQLEVTAQRLAADREHAGEVAQRRHRERCEQAGGALQLLREQLAGELARVDGDYCGALRAAG